MADFCGLFFCTSPGHWVRAKAAYLCTSPGHWVIAKAAYFKDHTVYRGCATIALPKPTISIMQNVHIAKFGIIHFTPTVVGATSYHWELKIPGRSWAALPHGTGASIAIDFNNGNFQHNLVRLKATNASGTTISNTPELTYGSGHASTTQPTTPAHTTPQPTTHPTAFNPKITAQPRDVHGTNGGHMHFSIGATGYKSISWFWRKSTGHGTWGPWHDPGVHGTHFDPSSTLDSSWNIGQVRAGLYDAGGHVIYSRTATISVSGGSTSIVRSAVVNSHNLATITFSGTVTHVGGLVGNAFYFMYNGKRNNAVTMSKTSQSGNKVSIDIHAPGVSKSGAWSLHADNGQFVVGGKTFQGTIALRRV